jgi:hypothetical protein
MRFKAVWIYYLRFRTLPNHPIGGCLTHIVRGAVLSNELKRFYGPYHSDML